MSPFFDRREQPSGLMMIAVVVAATAAVVSVWLILSSPEANTLSGMRAFDLGGGLAVARQSRGVERRTGTGLDMVKVVFSAPPAATKPDADPTRPAPALNEGASLTAPAAPLAARPAEPAPVTPAELAAAGLPVTPAGFAKLGSQKGLLSAAVAKLLDHPRVLKAVLDNRLVVDGLMGRDVSRRNCSDAGALRAELSDSKSSRMTTLLPLIQQALSKPAAATAMLTSELGSRLMACPSLKSLSSDPSSLMSVAMANPKALGLVTDPRVAQALSANPQAAGMFGKVQAGLGGVR